MRSLRSVGECTECKGNQTILTNALAWGMTQGGEYEEHDGMMRIWWEFEVFDWKAGQIQEAQCPANPLHFDGNHDNGE